MNVCMVLHGVLHGSARRSTISVRVCFGESCFCPGPSSAVLPVPISSSRHTSLEGVLQMLNLQQTQQTPRGQAEQIPNQSSELVTSLFCKGADWSTCRAKRIMTGTTIQ